MNVADIYHGSNAAATRKLLKQLESSGHAGRIAAQMFRAQKTSSRAKKYRGGKDNSDGVFKSFRTMAYETKAKALFALCRLLMADDCGMAWGWHHNRCAARNEPEFVLYVELPTGQVSWHVLHRYDGPDFAGKWDEARGTSEHRVIAHVQAVEAGLIGEPALF